MLVRSRPAGGVDSVVDHLLCLLPGSCSTSSSCHSCPSSNHAAGWWTQDKARCSCGLSVRRPAIS